MKAPEHRNLYYILLESPHVSGWSSSTYNVHFHHPRRLSTSASALVHYHAASIFLHSFIGTGYGHLRFSPSRKQSYRSTRLPRLQWNDLHFCEQHELYRAMRYRSCVRLASRVSGYWSLTGCSGGDLSNYQASSYSNCIDTCGANAKCVGVSFVSTTNFWFVSHAPSFWPDR